MEFWKDYRNRVRRGVDKNGKVKYHTKPLQSNHLFFSTGRFEDVQNPKYLYRWLSSDFAKTLDRIGLNERYDNLGKRHKITLHSFRAFVKTTISDLGYHDFSEYFIGHKHSTYWNKPEAEKLELFKKVEPYLTYLTYEELEAHGADIQTKMSEKDREIKELRELVEEQTGDIVETRKELQNINKMLDTLMSKEKAKGDK
ncbi:MAG: hypothetical protein M3P08_11420 [Thermoproteota archaeon]|nr:hypothetical protein [Thermoproteota archaeon]